jgi:hypothetical protein
MIELVLQKYLLKFCDDAILNVAYEHMAVSAGRKFLGSGRMADIIVVSLAEQLLASVTSSNIYPSLAN